MKLTCCRRLNVAAAVLVLLACSYGFAAQPRVNLPSVQSFMVSMPWPEYPAEARAKHITGSGKFDVIVRSETGVVIRVDIIRSTGSKLLDDAAVKALSRWRARPRTKLAHITVPVTFGM
jgi:TonB family protein